MLAQTLRRYRLALLHLCLVQQPGGYYKPVEVVVEVQIIIVLAILGAEGCEQPLPQAILGLGHGGKIKKGFEHFVRKGYFLRVEVVGVHSGSFFCIRMALARCSMLCLRAQLQSKTMAGKYPTRVLV